MKFFKSLSMRFGVEFSVGGKLYRPHEHQLPSPLPLVWNLPPLNCWSADQVPMQDRLTFDAQLSNTCFSIESIDWHEISEKRFLTFGTKHSLRLSSIWFDIVHYIKETHFRMLMIVLQANKKDLQKNPRSVISVIFNVALMPDLTVY